MAGRHGHDTTATAAGDQRAALWVVVGVLALVAVAMLVLRPTTPPKHLPATGEVQVQGTVTSVQPTCGRDQPSSGKEGGCGTARVRLSDGPEAGSTVTASVDDIVGAPVVESGDDIVLAHAPDNPGAVKYHVIDHQRGLGLGLLGVAFVLAVVAFGRMRGVAALVGLGVTFAVLMLFVLPSILAGRPPLLVAVVGAAGIALTVLYLTHGVARSTTVAVAGTLTSLTLTGVLSWLAVTGLHLTGVTDDTSASLGQLYGVDLGGLLLASILIGSLGVLDDVTVTQAVTVQELASADPTAGPGRLYAAALRVGRSHIAAVVNTIVLAYAGAALPLLVLVSALDDPLGQVLSDQLIATELVRSAVGTLGLISAVPVTTALAAWWAVRRPAPSAT